MNNYHASSLTHAHPHASPVCQEELNLTCSASHLINTDILFYRNRAKIFQKVNKNLYTHVQSLLSGSICRGECSCLSLLLSLSPLHSVSWTRWECFSVLNLLESYRTQSLMPYHLCFSSSKYQVSARVSTPSVGLSHKFSSCKNNKNHEVSILEKDKIKKNFNEFKRKTNFILTLLSSNSHPTPATFSCKRQRPKYSAPNPLPSPPPSPPPRPPLQPS